MADNSPYADLLGFEVEEVNEGSARISLKIEPQHMNGYGIIHGGVYASLADSAAGAAATSYGYKAVTMNCDLHYLKAGKDIDRLTAEAHVLKRGRSVIVVIVHIGDQDNHELFYSTFTYMNLGEPLKEVAH